MSKQIWDSGYDLKEGVFQRLGRSRQNAAFRAIVDRVDGLIRARFPEPGRARLLELGGGSSDWLAYFGEKYGCRLLAVDYSEKGCERLVGKLSKKNLKGTIICKDFRDVRAPDTEGPVDVVFSFGLLEHFRDRSIIYGLSRTLLSAGGLFIAVVPNLKKLNLRWLRAANPSLMNWHVSLGMADVLAELEGNGFEDVMGRYLGGLRLFAWSGNPFYATVKKAVNAVGEVLSRLIDVSSEKVSPYFIVSAWKAAEPGTDATSPERSDEDRR